MKMKKVLMILICLAVVFAMAGTVSGGNGINGLNSGNTEINYNVDESYIVTIPVAVTFEGEYLTHADSVSATQVLIGNGKKLTVSMESNNGYVEGSFSLNYGSNPVSKIPYVIELDGNPVTENPRIVLTVLAGDTEGLSPLTFSTTEKNIKEATKSGIHIDTLTFTCSVA
ncbi:MAG: hypothetical protein IJD66_03275 [Methanocorpusculum sp.]|nr:hypothetical protein [Methanocorpusculum sp.]